MVLKDRIKGNFKKFRTMSSNPVHWSLRDMNNDWSLLGHYLTSY